MAKDKKGKGSGTKDACYHKVKSRYSVWPSAYASGALVKCRKVGASNWGNKSESFEIDPKKHKAAQKNQKIRNMTKSPNENEAKVAAKKAKGPELPMEQYTAAVDFFMNEGINEDGVEIFIEELGLESFVEFVCDLSEEVLTEAKFDRIPPVTKTGKKISDLKGGPKASSIKSKRKIRATLRQKVDDESKSKPGFASFSKKASEVTSKSKKDNASKAAASAKKQQPEKKPVRDAIARGVFRAVDAYKKGMERHRAAMDTAKKAGKVVGAIAKEVPTGVKMAGKATKAAYKVATRKEEVEIAEGDKYDDVGKQAARMSLLNNPGPRSTPEQTAEKKARLEKKRGMKLDDHPQFKKEEVEEGYRVVSTSFKSGDGDPKDDVTIKKQKKVVSGDNLTKKGAERSANARRQEYGAGDAFQVQKTKTAKKRSSNAASEAEVKAKIDAKEKKQQKSRAQQSIAGMNRAGTPSGKVAAARLKTDKKFNKEEVDKRRAPKELLDRLNSRMVGWMADDGPNKPAYDAKQRLLKKAYEKRKRKGNETVDEANRLEKHLGIGSNTPENELSRMKRRASASGIGSEGPDGKPRQNTDPGTIRMNRGVARMVHKRNRGKSPSDPTYKKRRGIDPHADMKSYRDSPLGLPKGYKDPLNPKSDIGNKVNSKVKIKERKPKQGSNKIVKFKMTEEIVRSILDEAGKKCWKGYKKAGTQKLFGKTYNRCVKANEEVENVEEGLRDKVGEKVKKHINKYAYKQEIHNNPGWLRKPEKRAALNKAVRDDIKKNPKAAVKYAAGEVNRRVRQELRAAVGKGLKDRIRIPNED